MGLLFVLRYCWGLREEVFGVSHCGLACMVKSPLTLIIGHEEGPQQKRTPSPGHPRTLMDREGAMSCREQARPGELDF